MKKTAMKTVHRPKNGHLGNYKLHIEEVCTHAIVVIANHFGDAKILGPKKK